MKKSILVSLSLIFTFSLGHAQQSHPFPEDLRIKDFELTSTSFRNALQNLLEIKKHISNAKSIDEVTDGPLFYIGFHNNLTVLEGCFLKQSVALAKAEYRLAKELQSVGKLPQADVEKALIRLHQVESKYKKYLDSAGYFD